MVSLPCLSRPNISEWPPADVHTLLSPTRGVGSDGGVAGAAVLMLPGLGDALFSLVWSPKGLGWRVEGLPPTPSRIEATPSRPNDDLMDPGLAPRSRALQGQLKEIRGHAGLGADSAQKLRGRLQELQTAASQPLTSQDSVDALSQQVMEVAEDISRQADKLQATARLLAEKQTQVDELKAELDARVAAASKTQGKQDSDLKGITAQAKMLKDRLAKIQEGQAGLMSEGERKLQQQVVALSQDLAQAERVLLQVLEEGMLHGPERDAADKAARHQTIQL